MNSRDLANLAEAIKEIKIIREYFIRAGFGTAVRALRGTQSRLESIHDHEVKEPQQ